MPGPGGDDLGHLVEVVVDAAYQNVHVPFRDGRREAGRQHRRKGRRVADEPTVDSGQGGETGQLRLLGRVHDDEGPAEDQGGDAAVEGAADEPDPAPHGGGDVGHAGVAGEAPGAAGAEAFGQRVGEAAVGPAAARLQQDHVGAFG